MFVQIDFREQYTYLESPFFLGAGLHPMLGLLNMQIPRCRSLGEIHPERVQPIQTGPADAGQTR